MAFTTPHSDPGPWELALHKLQQEDADGLFQAIYAMARLKAVTDDTLIIALPFAYLRELIGPAELSTLRSIVAEVWQRPLDIDFVIEPQEEERFTQFASAKREAIERRKDRLLPGASREQLQTVVRPAGLNPQRRLDNFVVRDANQLAAAAAREAAQHPGRRYPLLFLCGGTGLGKSHLLHGIVQQMWEKDPQARLAICNTGEFVDGFIEALRTREVQRFRDRWLGLDALLVDDLHLLMGKPNCQEAFLATLSAYLESGRQVVIAADRKPRELNGLPERLLSRLEGGLCAELERPDHGLRVAILEQKCRDIELALPAESLDTIATMVQSSVRALEGCLTLVSARMALRQGQPLAQHELEQLILGFLSTSGQVFQRIDLATILNKVALHYHVTVADILGRRRTANITHPRQMAMFFARELTSMSLEEIGQAIGGRDHSTVIYAVDKIRGRCNLDKPFEREVDFVRKLLTGDVPPPRE